MTLNPIPLSPPQHFLAPSASPIQYLLFQRLIWAAPQNGEDRGRGVDPPVLWFRMEQGSLLIFITVLSVLIITEFQTK